MTKGTAVSGPNTSFDPKQVASLDADAVAGMVETALAAIADASTLADLKDVRLAHAGDRSPLALANREIGALPPAAKAEVGKRVGQARGGSSRRWSPVRRSSRTSGTSASSSRRPSTSHCPRIASRWAGGIR